MFRSTALSMEADPNMTWAKREALAKKMDKNLLVQNGYMTASA